MKVGWGPAALAPVLRGVLQRARVAPRPGRDRRHRSAALLQGHRPLRGGDRPRGRAARARGCGAPAVGCRRHDEVEHPADGRERDRAEPGGPEPPLLRRGGLRWGRGLRRGGARGGGDHRRHGALRAGLPVAQPGLGGAALGRDVPGARQHRRGDERDGALLPLRVRPSRRSGGHVRASLPPRARLHDRPPRLDRGRLPSARDEQSDRDDAGADHARRLPPGAHDLGPAPPLRLLPRDRRGGGGDRGGRGHGA